MTSIYIYNIAIRLAVLVLFTFFVLLCAWLVGEENSRIADFTEIGATFFKIGTTFFAVLVSASYMFFIYSFYRFIALIISINKNKFDIIVDKLVDKQDDGSHRYYPMEYSIDEMQLPDHRIPYVFLFPKFAMHQLKKAYFLFKLRFAKYKEYYIPEGKLYRWSNKYRMEHWAVYRWSEIGDEFYLVVANNKVLYAYNTKFFELQE